MKYNPSEKCKTTATGVPIKWPPCSSSYTIYMLSPTKIGISKHESALNII